MSLFCFITNIFFLGFFPIRLIKTMSLEIVSRLTLDPHITIIMKSIRFTTIRSILTRYWCFLDPRRDVWGQKREYIGYRWACSVIVGKRSILWVSSTQAGLTWNKIFNQVELYSCVTNTHGLLITMWHRIGRRGPSLGGPSLRDPSSGDPLLVVYLDFI